MVLTEEEGCAGGQDNRIFIYRNDGNQNFVAMPPIFPPGFAFGIAGRDINGDGKIDLITALGQGVGVYLGNGRLGFGEPIISSTAPYTFQVGDLNTDGKLDIAMIIPQDSFGTLYVGTALGNGDGSFQAVRQQSGSSVFESAFRIARDIDLADVEGDGKLDVVVTNNASNDISVFLNNGDGALRPHQRYGVGHSAFLSSLADFTGDGVIDSATVFALPPSGFANDVALLRGLSGPIAQPLRLLSVVSRKTHGSAGIFDINLPFTGEPAVECRSSGGNHTLVLTFDGNIVSGSTQVASGNAALSGSPIFAGDKMTVNLSGVADVQTVALSLHNMTDSSARVLSQAAVRVHVLAGDTTGNKTVNASDMSETKARSGLALTQQNFRTDVAVNGAINASDVSLVKSRTGATLNRSAR